MILIVMQLNGIPFFRAMRFFFRSSAAGRIESFDLVCKVVISSTRVAESNPSVRSCSKCEPHIWEMKCVNYVANQRLMDDNSVLQPFPCLLSSFQNDVCWHGFLILPNLRAPKMP